MIWYAFGLVLLPRVTCCFAISGLHLFDPLPQHSCHVRGLVKSKTKPEPAIKYMKAAYWLEDAYSASAPLAMWSHAPYTATSRLLVQEAASNHIVSLRGRSEKFYAADPELAKLDLIFVLTRMQIRMQQYPRWCAPDATCTLTPPASTQPRAAAIIQPATFSAAHQLGLLIFRAGHVLEAHTDLHQLASSKSSLCFFHFLTTL